MTAVDTFRCYGAQIMTDLDLSRILPPAGTGPEAYRLFRSDEVMPELAVKSPFGNSHGRPAVLGSDREPGPVSQGQRWSLEVEGVARFDWRSGASAASWQAAERGDAGRLAFWAIHVFLPLFLALEGYREFLHASAVATAKGALLFTAPTTGGKSTLARHFVEQGHDLVADDKLAYLLKAGQVQAFPAHAFCRPYRQPEDLGQRSPRFHEAALPLFAICELNRVAADAPVSIEAVEGFRAFDALARNSLFSFVHPPGERMARVRALAEAVPHYRVNVPGDLGRLPEVYAALTSELAL